MQAVIKKYSLSSTETIRVFMYAFDEGKEEAMEAISVNPAKMDYELKKKLSTD